MIAALAEGLSGGRARGLNPHAALQSHPLFRLHLQVEARVPLHLQVEICPTRALGSPSASRVLKNPFPRTLSARRVCLSISREKSTSKARSRVFFSLPGRHLAESLNLRVIVSGDSTICRSSFPQIAGAHTFCHSCWASPPNRSRCSPRGSGSAFLRCAAPIRLTTSRV